MGERGIQVGCSYRSARDLTSALEQLREELEGDEAVEAAARSRYEQERDAYGFVDSWDKLKGQQKQSRRIMAASDLRAAMAVLGDKEKDRWPDEGLSHPPLENPQTVRICPKPGDKEKGQ